MCYPKIILSRLNYSTQAGGFNVKNVEWASEWVKAGKKCNVKREMIVTIHVPNCALQIWLNRIFSECLLFAFFFLTRSLSLCVCSFLRSLSSTNRCWSWCKRCVLESGDKYFRFLSPLNRHSLVVVKDAYIYIYMRAFPVTISISLEDNVMHVSMWQILPWILWCASIASPKWKSEWMSEWTNERTKRNRNKKKWKKSRSDKCEHKSIVSGWLFLTLLFRLTDAIDTLITFAPVLTTRIGSLCFSFYLFTFFVQFFFSLSFSSSPNPVLSISFIQVESLFDCVKRLTSVKT